MFFFVRTETRFQLRWCMFTFDRLPVQRFVDDSFQSFSWKQFCVVGCSTKFFVPVSCISQQSLSTSQNFSVLSKLVLWCKWKKWRLIVTTPIIFVLETFSEFKIRLLFVVSFCRKRIHSRRKQLHGFLLFDCFLKSKIWL